MVNIQGTVLSILFARAISIAAAENGDGNKSEGAGWKGSAGEARLLPGWRRAGVINGELKQRRYRAMKKSSFRAHAVNRTA